MALNHSESGASRLAANLLLSVILLLAVIFLPVAIVLAVGMLPSIVAFMADATRDRTRCLTVSLINFITCFPFVIQVATGPQTIDMALPVITDPINIVIMYAGAVGGYFLDWTMAGISNVIMTARARSRLVEIEKQQKELERRFGEEVTGRIPVDQDGFPLDKITD
jgi:hypothetical protein